MKIIAALLQVLLAIHIASGNLHETGPLAYWLIVAAVCAFLAFLNSRDKIVSGQRN